MRKNKRGRGRNDTRLKKHPEDILQVNDEIIMQRDPQHPTGGQIRDKKTRKVLQRFEIVAPPGFDWGLLRTNLLWEDMRTVRAWLDNPDLNPTHQMLQWAEKR